MARIRTIKPEFWTSEQVAECSIEAAMLFVGIWNFSDDAGRHSANPRRLKGEVFPLRDVTSDQVGSWLEELIRVKLVHRYEVDGEAYIEVTGWGKHQKIDNPTYRYPAPNGSVPSTPPYRNKTAANENNTPNSSPNSTPNYSPPEGKGRESEGKWKGNGGEGNALKRAPPPTLEVFLALAERTGVSRVSAEKCWLHYETVGWPDNNGVVKYDLVLKKWNLGDIERAQNAAPMKNGIPSVSTVTERDWTKEDPGITYIKQQMAKVSART